MAASCATIASVIPASTVLVARALRTLLCGCLLAFTLAGADSARAANSFRMTALFSDQSGFYQFLQLQELSGLNDQRFAGLTLQVISRSGVVKTFVFPSDLPDANTANRYVMLATLASRPGLDIDYALPQGFFPTEGATLTFDGTDVWDYPALRVDGHTTLLRNGGFRMNGPCGPPSFIFRPFTGFPTGVDVAIDPGVEFYNPGLDHYFISTYQADMDALDSGRLAGWLRTGQLLPVWLSPNSCGSPPNLVPVCRFYIPPSRGDSHFFSASPGECSEVQARFPDFTLEAASAFQASVPDPATGACLYNQTPVYRVWNGRADSNHRYTTSKAIRDTMVQSGWIMEGWGPDAVTMCIEGGISSDEVLRH